MSICVILGMLKSVSKDFERRRRKAALFVCQKEGKKMVKIADFIFANWRKVALVYVIGGTVVFILSLAFLAFIAKGAADEEENFPDFDYDYPPKGWKRTASTIIISLFLSLLCAALWPVIPLAFFGVFVLTEITEHFPRLMGNLLDDDSDGAEEKGVSDEYGRTDPGHGSCDGRRGFPESKE